MLKFSEHCVVVTELLDMAWMLKRNNSFVPLFQGTAIQSASTLPVACHLVPSTAYSSASPSLAAVPGWPPLTEHRRMYRSVRQARPDAERHVGLSDHLHPSDPGLHRHHQQQ